MSLMSLISPLILLGLMIAWGFLIGKRNVIIRLAGVAISFIAAIITVVIFKTLGFSEISPALEALLSVGVRALIGLIGNGHCQAVFAVTESVGNVEGEGQIAALMAAHFAVIDQHAAALIHRTEVEDLFMIRLSKAINC